MTIKVRSRAGVGVEQRQEPRLEPAPAAPATIGERVILARRLKGWNQADCARALRIKPQSLGQIEKGKTAQPAADTLLAMRDAGFSPDYIMRGRGYPLLPHHEELLKEQTLLLLFRELRPDLRDEAIRSVQALRRAQGGPSPLDPFQRDPPTPEDPQ